MVCTVAYAHEPFETKIHGHTARVVRRVRQMCAAHYRGDIYARFDGTSCRDTAYRIILYDVARMCDCGSDTYVLPTYCNMYHRNGAGDYCTWNRLSFCDTYDVFQSTNVIPTSWSGDEHETFALNLRHVLMCVISRWYATV